MDTNLQNAFWSQLRALAFLGISFDAWRAGLRSPVWDWPAARRGWALLNSLPRTGPHYPSSDLRHPELMPRWGMPAPTDTTA